MVAALFFGVEVKGARRWVSLAGMSIQPSEFMKPAFVIVCAWLFAEHKRQPDIPGNLFAMHPVRHGRGAAGGAARPWPDHADDGTWGIMFFMAGHAVAVDHRARRHGVRRVFAPIRCSRTLPAHRQVPDRRGRHVPGRHGARGDHQWRLVRQGPGEGIVKRIIPDSHTDFIFSVAGEEFGIMSSASCRSSPSSCCAASTRR
jgi:cell division protein FtsW